jgi:alkylation response protein AidB-like acyl-CoA dehydrogenase
MYSLRLSPEQLAIRDTVRDFVVREAKPRALAPDRLEARERPLLREVLDQAARMGLRTLALAEDRGGAGADTLTCCIVTEELAAGDPDVAAVLAQTAMLAPDLFDRAMTADQRERFLPAFLADDHCHLALAEHEPDGDDTLGIDYHRARPPAPGFKTTARRSGDAWIINGFKDCVANAPVARLFAVQVSTEQSGASTLLVPHDAPGLRVKEIEAGARWCHGACGEVTFTDCRVPIENLLGVEGHPLAVDAGRRMAQEQALNLGIGRAAYEAALDYAQLRVQGARRIIEHQAIGAKLAGIAVRLEIARAAIWQAAWSRDHPEAFADGSLPDLPLASIAKVYASEAIYQATKDAAECFGAMGVMRDLPLQKYVHDALICLYSGAGNSDAKLRIAEALARYRRPSSPAALAAE